MENHHFLSKNATDIVLGNWKKAVWTNPHISADIYQTIASQVFPSPDSMLYDPNTKHSIAFEFKPPTETKRGILTGVGQSIAYLSSASLSYLVAPSHVEGYNISQYLEALYNNTIYGKLPTGLIVYDDEEAKSVRIAVDIADGLAVDEARGQVKAGRYWAKHQDMPLDLLWRILDEAYNLPEMPDRIAAIWKTCWDKYLLPVEQRTTLEIYPSKIVKHDGSSMYVFNKIKKGLKRKVDNNTITIEAALEKIRHESDTSFSGDNRANAYKKNYITFVKHLQLWDDNGYLTEDGLALHRTGKLHSPLGETFKNHFGRILLFNGKHLDLILDVEKLTRNIEFDSVDEAMSHIEDEFVSKGLFIKNPGRGEDETQYFLKYEKIIWGHIGVLIKQGNRQFIPGKGFLFDWKRITRMCSSD